MIELSVHNGIISCGFLVLLNATFSMIQFRRHVQLHEPDLIDDDKFHVPIDIQVEVAAGLLIGLFGACYKFLS